MIENAEHNYITVIFNRNKLLNSKHEHYLTASFEIFNRSCGILHSMKFNCLYRKYVREVCHYHMILYHI